MLVVLMVAMYGVDVRLTTRVHGPVAFAWRSTRIEVIVPFPAETMERDRNPVHEAPSSGPLLKEIMRSEMPLV